VDKDNVQGLIAQLDALFEAASVAIVGVPRGMKMGKLFLVALLEQGFPGDIYPVNPQAKEIDGLKAYPSVSAIPGPVDLAIVLVPHDHALSVVKECARKGVKGAVLFTAGYKETGTTEGRALEEELVRVARSSGMRLIGPNGMGLYCPKTGLSFFPQVSKEPGPVGIISHSGSLTNILGRLAPQKGIRFSKVVSLGNECDLTSADFLTYLGRDPDTRVIGTYLEGIKDGPFFLKSLRAASLEKPVILWKVGLTREGGRAAASHTGALAGSRGWSRSCGGIRRVGGHLDGFFVTPPWGGRAYGDHFRSGRTRRVSGRSLWRQRTHAGSTFTRNAWRHGQVCSSHGHQPSKSRRCGAYSIPGY
jgi:acetyltransferase